ncbi:MAG TPA: hypothetical protein VNB90_04570 [Cytophagaceae bacterium]|nr:hypothetical protein [Cytophagaceae bacterium]
MQASKILILLLFVALASCNSPKSPVELQKWVEENDHGLNKKKSIGEYQLEFQYKPLSYVLCKEAQPGWNAKNYKAREDELKGLEYYDVLLSVDGAKDIVSYQNESKDQQFYDKQYYLSFGFQNDIWLETDSVRVPCVLYHFERTYDLSNKRKIVLAFQLPENQKQKDRVLVINGERLGFGIVRTIFENNDIQSVPELDLESL